MNTILKVINTIVLAGILFVLILIAQQMKRPIAVEGNGVVAPIPIEVKMNHY